MCYLTFSVPEYVCLLPLQLLSGPLSPNESFLRYLTLPEDSELAIDLRQTAVVVMAHLDRLATPCMPPLCSSPTSHKVCRRWGGPLWAPGGATPACSMPPGTRSLCRLSGLTPDNVCTASGVVVS